MIDYGIWTILTPLLTISLAILTRQVILSLMAGIIFGYFVLNDFNLLLGIKRSLDGIINIFADGGNVKTIIFIILVGGIIRLVVVTGGVRSLVILLTEKSKIVKGKKSLQFLAVIITALIFVESSINQLVSGISTRKLAKTYNVPPEKMSYLIQTSCISVCSSVMINGWGAAMMGIIGVQISKGIITGEPFEILIHSMPYNLMAFFSLFFIAFYILTGISWGYMRKAEYPTKKDEEEKLKTIIDLDSKSSFDSDVIEHQNCNTTLNFFIPIISTVAMVPIMLFITGDGNFLKGSGSTSVYYSVMFGLIVSFVWFTYRKVFTVDRFFHEIYLGFSSMLKISSIMIFAFLIGNVCADLNTGLYIANVSSGVIPAGLTVGFIFIIGAIMSLATGTSWGTFAIMIPIGVQLGVSVGISPELMIGAAISGALFGDMTSPISADAIVASMATECDHIDHIRTQMPYALLTAFFVLIAFCVLGVFEKI